MATEQAPKISNFLPNIKPWTEEEIKNLEAAAKRYEKRWQEANRIDFGAVKEAWEIVINSPNSPKIN